MYVILHVLIFIKYQAIKKAFHFNTGVHFSNFEQVSPTIIASLFMILLSCLSGSVPLSKSSLSHLGYRITFT